jgi:adenine-specific DNA-methyltransferase
MPIEKLRPSFTFTEDRLNELQAVVPEAFADGKINWDTLREALGEYLEEENQEHFGLFWPGKREARRLAAMPSKGTLVPQPGEGVDDENTHNIFIEGDNLEVLKLLQKSYAGRVKMIYIDPPYNTGNDFVYRDDFQQPLDEYLRLTEQVNEQGKFLTTNSQASGRYHSAWLNMVYPRLRLSRNLLNDDGLIFVSIDDNELHNLSQVLKEVFGEECFVGILVWHSKSGGGSDKAGIVADHEYVVCFQKTAKANALSRIVVESEELDQSDDKGAYRRGRELNKWGSNSRREDRPTMFFPIPGPNGEDVYPIRNDGAEGCWRWGKKKMAEIVTKQDVEFVKRLNGTYIVYEKIRSTDPRSKPYRTWLSDIGTTADGSNLLKELFDGKKIFDFPKPIDLLKRLVDMGTIDSEDIVLDFFAGSCSTAHAVFEYNRHTENKLRFICVQLPEATSPTSEARKNGYTTITDIGRERLRRVIVKMKKGTEGQLDIFIEEDLGFKTFKLQRSNFSEWENYADGNTNQLELRFAQAESPLVVGWTSENMLAEILLLQGFPLDSRIRTMPEYHNNKVQEVSSDFCQHRLYVCLDENAHPETVAAIHLRPEDVLVCLDSALSDEAKITLADRCNLKVI